MLQQVDTYQKAGFDVVAGPCYNVGQLFPRHEHSLKNTQVWAQKMRANKMVGMLNTAWAVFPGRRLVPAKTRAFIDMLQTALGGTG